MFNVLLASKDDEEILGLGCSLLTNIDKNNLISGRNLDWKANSSYEINSGLVITKYIRHFH